LSRPPSSEFCVAVSGFKARGAKVAEVLGESYMTPTLHVIGRNDPILFSEAPSRKAADIFAVKRVEVHDGGKGGSPCRFISVPAVNGLL